jgi:hypothetical protein
MDPVTLVLMLSILGGFAFAWLIARIGAWIGSRGPTALVDVPMEPVSTDVINIAHIRAAGIGGLGLFAMALVVAWFMPRIGLTLGAGAVFGALLGAVMILRRRRTGPLPSSGGSAGANVVLSIEHPETR